MNEMKLLDVKDAAKLLRLKESTIRAWVLKRRMPYVKLGRRVFFRLSDCESLINSSLVIPQMEGGSVVEAV
jgi:excisionase family DNA binding protein